MSDEEIKANFGRLDAQIVLIGEQMDSLNERVEFLMEEVRTQKEIADICLRSLEASAIAVEGKLRKQDKAERSHQRTEELLERIAERHFKSEEAHARLEETVNRLSETVDRYIKHKSNGNHGAA